MCSKKLRNKKAGGVKKAFSWGDNNWGKMSTENHEKGWITVGIIPRLSDELFIDQSLLCLPRLEELCFCRKSIVCMHKKIDIVEILWGVYSDSLSQLI
jgi:hypothetical protein